VVSVLSGASVRILMYGRFGLSTSLWMMYPIEFMMYFLVDSSEMFEMFAIAGNSEKVAVIVRGRSTSILIPSISGYFFCSISSISDSSINNAFLCLYCLRSSIIVFVSWVSAVFVLFISMDSTLKKFENHMVWIPNESPNTSRNVLTMNESFLGIFERIVLTTVCLFFRV